MKRQFRLSRERAFSFERHVMLREKAPRDLGESLNAACVALADPLFAALGIAGESVRGHATEHAEDGAGWFVFPITRLITTLERPGATYRVCFERMVNGHLGCNEDDVRFTLEAEARRAVGGCYLYTSDVFTIDCTGLDTATEDAIVALFAQALDLSPVT